MKIKYNQFIIILGIIAFLCSCSSEQSKRQKALFKFEQNLSAIIKNNDTTTFFNNFVEPKDVPEQRFDELKEMPFIYEFTPQYLKNAIEKKTAIYGRIFSNSDNSIASFLPTDGNYDVNITIHSYKDNYIALITYGTTDYIEVNSIEFVLLYIDGKWKIFTINFFEI